MTHQDTTSQLPTLSSRVIDTHKGDYGRPLLVGGSRGMAGAIALAGMAALRSGAGTVTLGVADNCLETVASFEPAFMTAPLACDAEGRLVVAAKDALKVLADRATCIGCGPGLGRSSQITDLITWMYQLLPQPIVFDADALHALAEHPDVLTKPGGIRILTPHTGEFQKLLNVYDLSREKLELRAELMAASHKIIICLKGHRTFVTDGHQSTHNLTGNPGMATGGSGDVLTGIVTALFCQGLTPLDAMRLAAHVHGLAGDLAADEVGQVSLNANDLLRHLPAAFLQLES
ncbi:MAG: NAD(P)H-hydrate dehydratase [Pirellulaceae bacterium]|jgi:NAD(P)H-hydrate epimerase|nr:NAD(P)H-hydrate dehydratase [Pirellulaceae bacterium]HJN07366.1 NAD(P)H-hydrate dehydratase [Pirellulaceae bacterium]